VDGDSLSVVLRGEVQAAQPEEDHAEILQRHRFTGRPAEAPSHRQRLGQVVRGGRGDDRATVQAALAQQRRLRGPVVAGADPHLHDVDREDAPEADDGSQLVQEVEQVLDREHVPPVKRAGGSRLYRRLRC